VRVCFPSAGITGSKIQHVSFLVPGTCVLFLHALSSSVAYTRVSKILMYKPYRVCRISHQSKSLTAGLYKPYMTVSTELSSSIYGTYIGLARTVYMHRI